MSSADERIDRLRAAAEATICPRCLARPGMPCRGMRTDRRREHVHEARWAPISQAYQAGVEWGLWAADERRDRDGADRSTRGGTDADLV